MSEKRRPAEIFHVGEHIREELEARGWTVRDLAFRMGGVTARDIEIDELTVQMTMAVQDLNLLFTEELDAKLARAFDVTPGFLMNLDRAWREWMQGKP